MQHDLVRKPHTLFRDHALGTSHRLTEYRMAILVTGGAGYIGSHMALELIDKAERVVVLDNLSTGFRWAVPAAATFVEGDVGDQRLVGRLVGEHGITAIAHFAAKIVVPESVTDPLGYYANNTMKSRALIEAAVKSGVK